jgi:serine/threonine-protein phosphatase 4 regulatory subunit 4
MSVYDSPLLYCLQETGAWVKALCELIPMVDKEVLKSQVMSMALSKGQMEDNANSRIICARILGACAPYLVSG